MENKKFSDMYLENELLEVRVERLKTRFNELVQNPLHVDYDAVAALCKDIRSAEFALYANELSMVGMMKVR